MTRKVNRSRRLKRGQPAVLRGCGMLPYPGGQNPPIVLLRRDRLHTVEEWVAAGRPLYVVRWAERPHGGSKVSYCYARTATPTYRTYLGLHHVPHRAEAVWVGTQLPQPPGDHEEGWTYDPAHWQDAPDTAKAIRTVHRMNRQEARVRSWDRLFTGTNVQEYLHPHTGQPTSYPHPEQLGAGQYDPDPDGTPRDPSGRMLEDMAARRARAKGGPPPAA